MPFGTDLFKSTINHLIFFFVLHFCVHVGGMRVAIFCLLYSSDPAKASNHYYIGASKYEKANINKTKGKIASNTKIVGDFNTPL